MSSRERWTLYALLFFALMICLKNRWEMQNLAEFKQVVCSELIVQTPEGKRAISLNTSAARHEGGVLAVHNTNGQPVILLHTSTGTRAAGGGTVELIDASGQKVVLLQSTNSQGQLGTGSVMLVGANQQPVVGLLASHREVQAQSLGSGAVVVFGENRQPAVAMHASSRTEGEDKLGNGAVEVFGHDTKLATALRAASGGGMYYAIRNTDGKVIALGHNGQDKLSGLFAADPAAGGKLAPLMVGDRPVPYLILPWDDEQPASPEEQPQEREPEEKTPPPS